jgi:fucose 4-O-acetylase-like acetyltransferase
MSLDEMAAKTPASRDRYVDFLRAFSIATVVLGHWFIAVISWRGGRIGVTSAIGLTSGLWLATWFLQVMPLFFFVGGFSNAVSWDAAVRRGQGYRAFLRSRSERLLKPTGIFVAVWGVVQIILHATKTGSGRVIRATFLPFGPLWFLIVYLAVIAATPAMLRLHRRFGLAVPVALIAGTALVDVARFGAGLPKIGWLNLALVWLNAHQLGFFYADGTLPGLSRRSLAGLAAMGLAGMIVLTNVGVYPRSMIGTDVERISNMNPPTACLAALTLWLIALAMLARAPVSRWLAKPRPWKLTIVANSMIMTLFLWHLTAYLLVILALRPLGLGRNTDTTASWWAQRPVWLVAPAIILAALVAVFGRFERPSRRPNRNIAKS